MIRIRGECLFQATVLLNGPLHNPREAIPNTTQLSMQFAGSTYTVKKQFLTYTFANFVADFGGYLGLLLGHSLLSLYDIGKEIVFKMILRKTY